MYDDSYFRRDSEEVKKKEGEGVVIRGEFKLEMSEGSAGHWVTSGPLEVTAALARAPA